MLEWSESGRIRNSILVTAWGAEARAQRSKSGKLWFCRQGVKAASSSTASEVKRTLIRHAECVLPKPIVHKSREQKLLQKSIAH